MLKLGYFLYNNILHKNLFWLEAYGDLNLCMEQLA